MEKTLLIRVDCNPEIASGHLMRSLSIAREACKQGMKSVFLMSDNTYKKTVTEQGFEFVNLSTDWRKLTLELPILKKYIGKYKHPILLIDTYSINSEYISELKGIIPLIYLGSKKENIGDVDCIINYSSDIDEDFYTRTFPNASHLLGVRYVPLREEFQRIKISLNEPLKNILLTTGNTDRPHFIPYFLERIIPLLRRNNIICHVIVGRMFDNQEELKMITTECGLIQLHTGVSDMAPLMQQCQLAVSANGTTVYELAACGVPTISFSIAEEQEASGKSLGNKGILRYCGLFEANRDRCIEKILDNISELISDDKERISLAAKANEWIDGYGCKYIVNHLKNL